MTRSLLILVVAVAAITAANAFVPSTPRATTALPRPLKAVVDVSSEKEFDEKIAGAGDALVVIDYSTTWCGPCKVIAPKFDELSEKYTDSVFIKVRCQLPTRDVRATVLNIWNMAIRNVRRLSLGNAVRRRMIFLSLSIKDVA